MVDVIEFKLNNRFRVYRMNPEFIYGIKVTAESTLARWEISERLEKLAAQCLGDHGYFPRSGPGWNLRSQWAISYGSNSGIFFFFKSREDWETIKLLYTLKHGETV